MENHRAIQLNLNKYDYEASTPPPEMRTKLSQLDDILWEEIKIVSPDILVFTVGPHYEFPERICKLFETTLVSPCPSNPLVILPTEKLDALVCLTYHPSYLQQSKLMSSVIAEIKEQFARLRNP